MNVFFFRKNEFKVQFEWERAYMYTGKFKCFALYGRGAYTWASWNWHAQKGLVLIATAACVQPPLGLFVYSHSSAILPRTWAAAS